MATSLSTWTTPTSQNPGIEYHLSYSVSRPDADRATFTIYWTVYTTSGSFAYDLDLKMDTSYSSAVTAHVVTGSNGITATSGNSGSTSFTCSGLAAAGGSITMTLTGIRPTGGETGTGSTTRTISYPAKYNAPSATSTPSASRINSTTNRISWTNNSTTDGPYSNVYIEHSFDGVNWSATGNTGNGTSVSWDHTAADPSLSYVYRTRAYGSGGYSAYSAASGYTTYLPSAPASTIGVMTVSDDPANDGAKVANSGTVTITHPTFSAYNTPTNYYLELWNNRTNAWAAYTSGAFAGGTSTAISVSGLTADSTYQARVRYANVAGYSSWVSSSSLITTVASPTGPVVTGKLGAVRNGLNIDLSWLNPSGVSNNTEVYWSSSSDAGSTWSAWTKLTTVAATTQNYTHVGPDSTKQHKYYVVNTTTTSLVSHPLASDPVVLLTAPGTPSISGCPYSAKTDYFDIADTASVSLSWVHTPLDGTAQTKYEIQTRESGASWPTTSATTSSASSYSFTVPSNGKTYEWRVRTWGSHADPSAWSAVGTFKTSAKPTLTVTTPAAPATGDWRIWPSPSITVVHTFSDAESKAQIKHRTELYNEAGTTLLWYSESSNADLTEEVKYTLQDGTGTKTNGIWSVPSRYIIKKKVMDADGLWSTVFSRQIEVVWDTPPATPDAPLTITASIDATTATITWTAPASADDGNVGDSNKNPWTRVAIERWDNVSGSWTFIKNVSTRVGGSTTDTVSVNRRYLYRIKAQATSTSSADNTITLISSSPILTQSTYVESKPTTPSTISVTQPSDIVIVSWKNVASFPCQIEIQRKNNDVAGSDYVVIATLDASQEQFPDISVNGDTNYSYKVVTISGELYGDESAVSTLTTKSITNTTLQGITVPPVRRNGPRESIKENVEAAEIGAIAALVRDKIGTLKANIATLSTEVGVNNELLHEGIESARYKSEMK